MVALSHDYSNRTMELYSCIESFKLQGLPKVSEKRFPKYSPSQKKMAEIFTPIGHTIISDIGITSHKISKLSLMLQKDEEFIRGRIKEILNLVEIIEADLSDSMKSINSITQKMKASLDSINLPAYSQLRKHYESLFFILQSFLASITLQFRDIVIKNKSVLAFNIEEPQEPTPLVPEYSDPQPNQFFQPTPARPVYTNPLLEPFDSKQVREVRPPSHQFQQQQLLVEKEPLHRVIPVYEQEIRQRDVAMHQVEQTIVQLGEIYTQFTILVAEQGDLVTRIDGNVDESFMNIESAHDYLVDFLRNAKKRRYFMYKVFGCLFLFFIMFYCFFR